MATARHPKASGFVQQRLFAELATFAELEQRIAHLPDEKARGDAFEVFAEAYLATQRKHDAETVWPLTSVPTDLLAALKLGTQDYGIDGVLKTRLGNQSAYQVKFRTGRPALTWRELSTFMGLADSPNIHSRILLTNCDELPAVLNDRQGFFCIRGTDLDRLEAGDFQAIAAWLADSIYQAPRKTPQPHQAEALEKILPAFQEHDRVSAIMACGTGKTLVALWVAEKVARAVGSRAATPRKLASYEVAGNVPTNFIRPEGTPDVHRPFRTDSVLDGQPDTSCLANFQSPCGTNAGGASVPASRGGQTQEPAREDTRPTSHSCKILVLLPSLALLRQTLHEWLRETSLPSLAYLCVCSDATVKEGVDALTTAQSDLDFEVSTDAASVRAFLDARFAGPKIIFCTYQSATVIGEALQVGSLNCPARECFDLGIFDEAHKTAGREGRNFALALEDKNLPIRKRLFVTATPRHYNPHQRDREGESKLVFSMDRPEVYGPQIYRLTFAEAARRGIICGYKVIVSVITSEMVTNERLSRGEVLVNGDAVLARQVANQIALRDAVEKYGTRKIFTFHQTVKSAQSFVSSGSEGVGTHLNGDGRAVLPRRPDQNELAAPQRSPTDQFQLFHVNGTMPTARREHAMRDFRAAPLAVMSNARCLTEGVDVPAVDMVAFLSPRRSLVDIVQATGRAMRRSPGKTTGYVLVPLYVELAAGETVEAAVSRANFDEVWDVLQSLQEQDDVLAEIIRKLAVEKGRTGKVPVEMGDRVEVLGEYISLAELKSSVISQCFVRIADNWDVRFGELLAYKERFNNCDVPARWSENRQLGIWVVTQRQAKKFGELNQRQIDQLDKMGFSWQPRSATWEDMFERLLAFKQKTGHCAVPQRYKADPDLGIWVNRQRAFKKAGIFRRKDRISKLNLAGFSWYSGGISWEQMLLKLIRYKTVNGHFCVTKSQNPKLAFWIRDQRHLKKKGRLNVKKVQSLDDICFPWKMKIGAYDHWEEMYKKLLAYKSEQGNCNVPTRWKDKQLANWVVVQRRTYKRNKKLFSLEHSQRLNKIGFQWQLKKGPRKANP